MTDSTAGTPALQATRSQIAITLPASPVVLGLALLLACLVVPPAAYLIIASLHQTAPDGSFGAFTFANYTEVVANPRFLVNLLNTVLYGAGAAVVALLIGGTQAWIVERTNTPLRQYTYAVSIVSLAIPSVLYTVSLLLLLGKTGPVNQLLMAVSGSTTPVLDVYSLAGMILIEGIEFSPLCFLLLASSLRNSDAALEEAAMMSGGSVLSILRRITLVMALPGLLALLLLNFIRAIESFETPALVGRPGNIIVLTTDIFETLQSVPPDYGQAGAFSVMLMALVALLLQLYGRLSRNAARYQTISGKGYRPRVLDLGPMRWVTLAILASIFLLTIGIPLLMLAWVSFQPYYAGISFQALGLVTFKHYDRVLADSSLWDAATNTVLLGASTAVLVAPLTALCAWLAVRRHRGAFLLDQLASTPLVFPAIVMGVAMLELFLNLPLPLYGTLASIIIACTIRFLPYGMRYSYAGALQISRELEEAAAVSGATGWDTFVRVVLPLLLPAVVAGGLFIFLMAVKAASIPILLSGPQSRVIAVTLFDMWQNGLIGELSALGMLWSLCMIGVSVVCYLAMRRAGLQGR